MINYCTFIICAFILYLNSLFLTKHWKSLLYPLEFYNTLFCTYIFMKCAQFEVVVNIYQSCVLVPLSEKSIFFLILLLLYLYKYFFLFNVDLLVKKLLYRQLYIYVCHLSSSSCSSTLLSSFMTCFIYTSLDFLHSCFLF